jgi:hypothetical protein
LFLLISALYLRGFVIQDKVFFSFHGRFYGFGSFPHHVSLLVVPESSARSARISWSTDPKPIPARLAYLEVGAKVQGSEISIWLPHWLSLLSFSVLPLHWMLSHRVRRAKKLGLCSVCGYDLRATPRRCPECGTMIATALVTNL